MDRAELITKVRGGHAEVDEILAALSSLDAEALPELAAAYNWDGGFEVPRAIMEHPDCDLGTAVALFWLAGAESTYEDDEEPSEHQREWHTFCRTLIERVENGRHPPGPNRFDPELGRVARYKLEKRGVPPVFLDPVERA